MDKVIVTGKDLNVEIVSPQTANEETSVKPDTIDYNGLHEAVFSNLECCSSSNLWSIRIPNLSYIRSYEGLNTDVTSVLDLLLKVKSKHLKCLNNLSSLKEKLKKVKVDQRFIIYAHFLGFCLIQKSYTQEIIDKNNLTCFDADNIATKYQEHIDYFLNEIGSIDKAKSVAFDIIENYKSCKHLEAIILL